MAKIVFVLTTGRTPQTWDLPYINIMADKPGSGKKFINYYPGENSIYKEDVEGKNKDIKPSEIPLFEFNSATNKTELTVDDSNTNLLMYLKAHPWFGRKYEITSETIESEKLLKGYELKEKAIDLVKHVSDLETRSKAMVVFGIQALHFEVKVAEAKLKQLAFEKPEFIIGKLSGVDYESQFISAQAYIQGIVKNNMGHTMVVWGDTEQSILTLAAGETGNIKLGNFLNNGSDQALITMQTIAQKLGIGDEPKTQTASAPTNTISEKELKAKDDEIAELRAALEAANKGSVHELNPPVVDSNKDAKVEMTLEEATAKYIEKFNKEPGPTVKGDLEWILKKLKE
ncbi:hypothetical protein [Myroides odoratus]|uniref:Uncharacterized protein n=1 Tax=Myroides odoratus TaxID=256 RepID=A0A9Q6Z3W4_MYROD|nr:hypothetical protein [Myroides odoratus]EHQ41541.1 hypothetical protein Myrod_0705 [Myroides odoratus DSM 2801]EKB02762.1 hypothetical protein HMPREF9716_03695 [Myroides odoratus CIP 103059]QQT98960.1 hypothetical protein I6I88_12135 [Myroides odoratus]WQD58852.1 hypothetical protein U0010_06840 [Myroides odoratus]STZ28804.1 Uncharacterised protein [Myroides odoratus]